MSRKGALLICDNCGGEIPQQEHRHTWVGPIPAKGEAPRHYHLAREYPECRMVGGADPMPGEIMSFIELKLAETFTSPGPDAVPASERMDQGMTPVTPRQVSEVVADVLRKAGFIM